MPPPDGSVDVVISNCVVNLPTDKPASCRDSPPSLRNWPGSSADNGHLDSAGLVIAYSQPAMADLLTAAAQALNAPEAIVRRSAEARAKASGASVDEVLSAWSGGTTITVAAAPLPPATTSLAPASTPVSPAPVSPVPVSPAPVSPAPVAPEEEPLPIFAPPVEQEPEPLVPPAPLRQRIRVAGKLGALSGAALGLIAALVASPWLLPGATVVGEEGSFAPAVEVSTRMFILGAVLLSMVFGLVVASLARTIPGWMDPGMALAGSARSSVLVGLGSGVLLGAVGGGVITSAFAIPIEGVEGRVALPLLSALVLGLVGGAALGWLTAAFVQVIGLPAAVLHAGSEEVTQVRSRLGTAVSVPLAGLFTLLLLVLPFAFVLIRSSHLTPGGAAVLAVLTAASILAFAGLSASRPGMKITRGEFLLALTGIGVVVTIIVAVFLARSASHEGEVPNAEASLYTLAI